MPILASSGSGAFPLRFRHSIASVTKNGDIILLATSPIGQSFVRWQIWLEFSDASVLESNIALS